MISEIHVRPATLADVPGIQRIHAGENDPWADIAEAAVWVNHRLLRGFHVDVATLGSEVLGHAEWIKDTNPAGKFLYLGMLQVHPNARRRGVGKAMLAAGAVRASNLGCSELRTIPDEGAYGFYTKCGFTKQHRIVQYNLPHKPATMPSGWAAVCSVPEHISQVLPFRLGWAGQACSAHMWEVCNRPVLVAGDVQRHLTAKRFDSNAYVQVRYMGGKTAFVVAWAVYTEMVPELIRVAMALATRVPVHTLCISCPEREVEAIDSVTTALLPDVEVWAKPVAVA